MHRDDKSGEILSQVTSNSTVSYYRNAYYPSAHTFNVIVTYVWNGKIKTITGSAMLNADFTDRNQIWPNIVARAESKWSQSIAWADANQGKIKEYGFIASLHSGQRNYYMYDDAESADYPCGLRVDIDLAKYEFAPTLTSGGKYNVAGFHTHPPHAYCNGYQPRTTGPSSYDASPDIPGFVYDYTMNPLPVGHKINAPHKRYDFGTNKRTKKVLQ